MRAIIFTVVGLFLSGQCLAGQALSKLSEPSELLRSCLKDGFNNWSGNDGTMGTIFYYLEESAKSDEISSVEVKRRFDDVKALYLRSLEAVKVDYSNKFQTGNIEMGFKEFFDIEIACKTGENKIWMEDKVQRIPILLKSFSRKYLRYLSAIGSLTKKSMDLEDSLVDQCERNRREYYKEKTTAQVLGEKTKFEDLLEKGFAVDLQSKFCAEAVSILVSQSSTSTSTSTSTITKTLYNYPPKGPYHTPGGAR